MGGSLPWHAEAVPAIRNDLLLVVLNRLTHPFPKSWQMDIGPDGRLEVLDYYPNARREPLGESEEERYVPADVQPDKEEDDGLVAAIRCRLSVGKAGSTPPRQLSEPAASARMATNLADAAGSDGNEEVCREFWVGQEQGPRIIEAGGEPYLIHYNPKVKELGFELKLERAEQPVDPGTQTPAGYTSYVQLTDKKLGIEGECHVITMNEPLEHRGYKFYQSTCRFLDTNDSSGKRVSMSGFSVGYDLGLGFKYAGSIMLVLGIACMFFMNQRSEVRDQRSEVRDQKSEVRDQKSEVRDQKSAAKPNAC